jgi:enoyl-[acyl-carrier protein] reductase II
MPGLSNQAAGKQLARAFERGAAFLGCRHAVLGGAMAWISEHVLVSAISNAGGFGVLAGAAMRPQELQQEIAATRHITDRPFGVNLVTLHPAFDESLQVCLDERVSHVIVGGGIPSKSTLAAISSAGAKVICFAPSLALAKRMINNGADALIIEGMEAGGHIGPTTTTVLAQEILPFVTEVPVFVAGGIGRGEAIAAYLRMGAAGCQLGTRFACTKESVAHAEFKQALIRASARDAVVSPKLDGMFNVIPVRALRNKAMDEFRDVQRELLARMKRDEITQSEAVNGLESFWSGRLRRAVWNGDTDNGSMMAGQSVGCVTGEWHVADIMDELIGQARSAFKES